MIDFLLSAFALEWNNTITLIEIKSFCIPFGVASCNLSFIQANARQLKHHIVSRLLIFSTVIILGTTLQYIILELDL